MLHVRVVSPVALTGQLTSRLATAPGVQNMVTRAGAVRRPTGDAVEFDLRDGAANPVFARVGGVAIAYASWHEAWGSLLQLLLNVCLLILVGAAGLSTQRVIWRRRWL